MRRAVYVITTLLVLFILVGAVFILLNYDNVTVSGQALVSGAVALAPTIQKIDFTDTQTGTITSSHFILAPHTTNLGNYSVTLKNGHTYNVYISFFVFNHWTNETQFITTFTVNAPAGQTAITKDFMYPNPP